MNHSIFNDKKLFFYYIIIAAYGFSLGLTEPLIGIYILSKGGSEFDVGIAASIYAICLFVLAPFWGRLSDKLGRKTILALALFGGVITYFGIGFSNTITFIFMFRAVGGCFACATASMLISGLSDLLTQEQLPKKIGYYGLIVSIGNVLGSFVGGYLYERHSSVPFITASILLLCGIFIVFFCFSSVKKPDDAMPNIPANHDSLASKVKIIKNYFLVWILIMVLYSILENAYVTMFPIYVQKTIYADSIYIGNIFAWFGLVTAITQGFGFRKLYSIMKNSSILAVSSALNIGAILLILLCHNQMVLILPVSLLAIGSGLLITAVNTYVAQHAGNYKGTIMGILQSTDSIGRIFSSLVGCKLMMYHVNLGFIFTIVLTFIGSVIAFTVLKHRENKNLETTSS